MVSLRHVRTLPFYMTGHGRRYTSHHKHTCLVSRTGAYYIYLKRRESLNSCFITIIITTYVILQLMCQLMLNAMKMYQVSLLYTTTLTSYVASLTAQHIVNRGNGYETRQSSLLYVFVLFFGLDPAQNTIVVYSVLRN